MTNVIVIIGTRSVMLYGVTKRGAFVVGIVGEGSHVLIEAAVSMSGQASAECVCE